MVKAGADSSSLPATRFSNHALRVVQKNTHDRMLEGVVTANSLFKFAVGSLARK